MFGGCPLKKEVGTGTTEGSLGGNGTEATFVKSLGIISPSRRRFYFRELKHVLAWCLDHDVVNPFRAFVRKWIKSGAPLDPAAFYAPRPSLKVVIRQMVSALGPEAMGSRAFDARLWLTQPEARSFDPMARHVVGKQAPTKQKFFKPFAESYVPWNMFLHAPEGTPYHQYNIRGLEQSLVDEVPDDEPWLPKGVA